MGDKKLGDLVFFMAVGSFVLMVLAAIPMVTMIIVAINRQEIASMFFR